MKFNLNHTASNILKGRSVTSSILSGAATSGVSGPLRGILLGLMGRKKAADVYITDLETNDKMQLAYVPEKITANESARFQSYNIIDKGEVKIPKGENLSTVSWDAILPGESMLDYPFIKSRAWEDPSDIVKRWSKWKTKGTKLNLLITQTAVNLQVYLQNFSIEPSGAMGNFHYNISFVAAKDMKIMTVEEADAAKAAADAEEQAEQTKLKDRTPLMDKIQASLGVNDTIWTIAQGCMGDGSKWMELGEMNRDKISDIDNIAAGTPLRLR